MPLDDYTIKSYAEKFGSEICCSIVKNLTYLEHVHRSYEILYLLKGQIETEVQGHRFTLNKGDLLFIANGAVHSYASPFESLSLLAAFSPQDAQQFTTILQQSGRQFCYLPAAEINGSLDMAVQGVADGIRNNASRVSLVAYINLILAQVVAGLDKQPVSQSRKNTALDDALMYISDMLPNSIAADDVASHTGVSRFQISRLFSQYIGTNLSTYCALMHINAAPACWFRQICQSVRSISVAVMQILAVLTAILCVFPDRLRVNIVFRKRLAALQIMVHLLCATCCCANGGCWNPNKEMLLLQRRRNNMD